MDAYIKIDSEKMDFTIPVYGKLGGSSSRISDHDHLQKDANKSMFSLNADNILEVPNGTDV